MEFLELLVNVIHMQKPVFVIKFGKNGLAKVLLKTSAMAAQ